MSTFIQMVDRIAGDLRRSNLTDDIKTAINDAIAEAAKNRFWFNEMHTTFNTVVNQEYYDDLDLVEIDAIWYWQNNVVNGSRVIMYQDGKYASDWNAAGSNISGQLDRLSRYGGQLRLDPIPNVILTVHLDGYGKLTPSPLTLDGDTNAWLTEGEQYIRALAKRNVLRDKVRDYREAATLESIAEDYKAQLEIDTAMRSTTDTLRSTAF